MSEPVFGYWPIRGCCRGSPFRMLLAYVGAKYEDKRYSGADRGAQWFAGDKPLLAKSNPFVNLPYWKDGDMIVSHTPALFSFFGRKFDLNGKSEVEMAWNEQALAMGIDLRDRINHVLFPGSDDFEKYKQAFVGEGGTMDKGLAQFESHLELVGKKYLTGDSLTTSDFLFYEVVRMLSFMRPGLTDAYPRIKAYYEGMCALDFVVAYEEKEKDTPVTPGPELSTWSGGTSPKWL